MLAPLPLGEPERVVGPDPDRWVEQCRPLDPRGVTAGELEDRPRSEAVPDPGSRLDPGGVERLEHVVDVRRERPRRLPGRLAVAAEVECEHVKPIGEPLLRKVPKPPAVGSDPVQADDRRRVARTPLVDVQLHPPRSSTRS